MELFSIIIGNIRTFSFAKFVQFQENSAAIKVFFLFCSLKICWSYAYILTNFNLYMPINAVLLKEKCVASERIAD